MQREVTSFLSSHYGLPHVRLVRLRSFKDINYHVVCEHDHFVLKLFSHSSSEVTTAFLRRQFKVMCHLTGKGYRCPRPIKNIHREFISQFDCKAGGDVYLAILLTYIRGTELIQLAPLSAHVLHQTGAFLASLRRDMKEIPDEKHASVTEGGLWSLENFPGIKKHLYIIESDSDRTMLSELVAEFELRVLPKLDLLEKGVIHGDVHDENLIWLPPLPDVTAVNQPEDTPLRMSGSSHGETCGCSTQSAVIDRSSHLSDSVQINGTQDEATHSVSSTHCTMTSTNSSPLRQKNSNATVQYEDCECTYMNSIGDYKSASSKCSICTTNSDGFSSSSLDRCDEEYNKGAKPGPQCLNRQENIASAYQPKPFQDQLPCDPKKVFGLIDFGDMGQSRYVFELAISVAYLMMFSKRKDYTRVGREVIQGYLSEGQLTDAEREVLYLSVCARYCQELVLALMENEQQPDNSEYLQCGFDAGWPQLRTLWRMGQHEVLAIWFDSS